jgi:hypothetical protein
MTLLRTVKIVALSSALLGASALPAAGQGLEIGASLANVSVHFGADDDTMVSLGVGSTFLLGGINPGVYASFFLGPKVAIESQLGLIWMSMNSRSQHLLNVGAQVDYFLSPLAQRSAYVFGAYGVLDSSGSDILPKVASVGLGYRIPVGDSLAVRLDGRWSRFMIKGRDGNNAMIVGVSIGGLFLR